jgi:hypothetical protein
VESQQIRKFDMLRRVQRFLDESAAGLSALNATAARRELDALVEEMTLNETSQAVSTLGVRAETAKKAALRRRLWNHHMRPVTAIAAAHLRTVPEFSALKMPLFKAKGAVVVQSALAMADAARAHSRVFVEDGRPADFADALVAAAGAFRASIDARGKGIGDRAAARKGLQTAGSRANAVVRVIDALVKIAFEDDPKALAGWKSARRIGRGRVAAAEATSAEATAIAAPKQPTLLEGRPA